MVTFFGVLLVLIIVNAVLMYFSLNTSETKKSSIDSAEVINDVVSKIYRKDYLSADS